MIDGNKVRDDGSVVAPGGIAICCDWFDIGPVGLVVAVVGFATTAD